MCIRRVFVAGQDWKQRRIHIIRQKTVSPEGTQCHERFLCVFKGRLIGGRHANSNKAGFRERTGGPIVNLQQPLEQSRMVNVGFPTATEQHVHVEQPTTHGKSSSICLTVSVVIGGAPGGASNSKVPFGPATSRAPCGDWWAGRRRTERKRTSSSFCSGDNASVAACISSSVLMPKSYHRCLSSSSSFHTG